LGNPFGKMENSEITFRCSRKKSFIKGFKKFKQPPKRVPWFPRLSVLGRLFDTPDSLGDGIPTRRFSRWGYQLSRSPCNKERPGFPARRTEAFCFESSFISSLPNLSSRSAYPTSFECSRMPIMLPQLPVLPLLQSVCRESELDRPPQIFHLQRSFRPDQQ